MSVRFRGFSNLLILVFVLILTVPESFSMGEGGNSGGPLIEANLTFEKVEGNNSGGPVLDVFIKSEREGGTGGGGPIVYLGLIKSTLLKGEVQNSTDGDGGRGVSGFHFISTDKNFSSDGGGGGPAISGLVNSDGGIGGGGGGPSIVRYIKARGGSGGGDGGPIEAISPYSEVAFNGTSGGGPRFETLAYRMDDQIYLNAHLVKEVYVDEFGYVDLYESSEGEVNGFIPVATDTFQVINELKLIDGILIK